MAFNEKEYKARYMRETYYKPTVRVHKEKKEVIEAVALKTGKTISRLFVEAFEDKYKVDLSIPTNKILRDNK